MFEAKKALDKEPHKSDLEGREQGRVERENVTLDGQLFERKRIENSGRRWETGLENG